LFDDIRISGRMPDLAGGDGIAVTVDNGGGNKIDAYLQVTTVYESDIDPVTGEGTARATITLANTVDPDGLPDYAVGNSLTDGTDLSRGTNRMLLSVYSGLPAVAGTLDGEPARLLSGGAFGWQATETWIDIPPGETRTLVVDFGGRLLSTPAVPGARPDVTVRPQVMSLPQVYEIR
jgi:hypothetical protein